MIYTGEKAYLNRGLELFPQIDDILGMSEFLRGMDTVGELFPAPIPYTDYPLPDSAWKGVANSFREAGDDLRFAIKECSDAKRESKQAT